MRTLTDIRNQRRATREHIKNLPYVKQEIEKMLKETTTKQVVKRSK